MDELADEKPAKELAPELREMAQRHGIPDYEVIAIVSTLPCRRDYTGLTSLMDELVRSCRTSRGHTSDKWLSTKEWVSKNS